MSTTAVGLTTPLQGPLPVARRYSLLKTPGILVDEAGANEDPRWLGGVNVAGYPAGVPHSWEPCTTGTMRVKEDAADLFDPENDSALPRQRFDPVVVYFPVQCTTIGNLDELVRKTEAALDATLSHGVEKALASEVAFSSNPFLGDGNLVKLNGETAVNPLVGLGLIENAIGLRTGRQGIIHSTPAVVSAWGFGAGLSEQPVDEDPPEVGLRTPAGTPVISGSGYIGTRPVGSAPPGATQDWVFATGPVEVRVADADGPTIMESIDQNINQITIRPERYVLADWDTALQVGVLIDWSL